MLRTCIHGNAGKKKISITHCILADDGYGYTYFDDNVKIVSVHVVYVNCCYVGVDFVGRNKRI